MAEESVQATTSESPKFMRQCQAVVHSLLKGSANSVCSESHILELFLVNRTMDDSEVLDVINNSDARSSITGMTIFMAFTYDKFNVL